MPLLPPPSRRRVKHKAVKNTAEPPAVPPTTVPPGAGIRSSPNFGVYDASKAVTPQERKRRVRTSRALRKELPFVEYVNRVIAEEALGDGMSVTSASLDLDFRDKATKFFNLWGSTPAIDLRGRLDIYSCQAMIGSTCLGDGELFTQKVRDTREEALKWQLEDTSKRALQLQFLTTDKIGQGESVKNEPGSRQSWEDGILWSELDRMVKCRILQRGSGGNGERKFIERDASAIIHTFLDEEFNQRRGQPAMFRGEKSALDALDIRAIEKFSAKLRATFLGAITTATGEAPKGMRGQIKAGQKPGEGGESVDDGKRYLEIAGGVVLPVLAQGETIEFFTGQQGLTFAEFLGTLMCEIAYAYGIPPEYVWRPGAMGSAATRLVLKKVSKLYARVRRAVRQFLQEVWNFVIGDAIQRGELPMVDDWNQIRCKGGNDLSIDVNRDEKAEQERLLSFTSNTDIYADGLGMDGRTIRYGCIDEIADSIQYGEKKHGLPWFLCLSPRHIQAITGLASSLDLDLVELMKQAKGEE